MGTLRWGVLGTGRMASRFVTQVQELSQHQFVACGSRSIDASQRFGAEFGIPNRYGEYDSVLRDPDVDIVYVCLPNNLHREWAVRSAVAGKHILCEKPLAVNANEAQDIVAAARANDVFLMEAFMYRCHPQIEKLVEIVRGGSIGHVRLIHTSFSYNMGPQYENIRMANSLGGGGVMDVGSYGVSIARLLAAEEPTNVEGVAHIGMRSRVDEVAVLALGFPSGLVAAVTCGMQVAVEQAVTVYGSEGSVHLPSPWFGQPGLAKIVVTTSLETSEIVPDGEDLPIYAREAEHVREHIEHRQSPAVTWEDSLGNMVTLDAVRAAIGLRFDCE